MMKRAAQWTLSAVSASGSWASTSRYLRSLRGALRPHYTPKLKKRTALMRELKERVFRRHRSQPIERVINLINPVLRGWVNYFAVGALRVSRFSFIKDWVEKKVRRQLAHAQKRKGFGWGRWSKPWLCDTLGLFNAYRVRRDGPKVAPQQDRSHKPRHEANGGAQCGEIRTLRATWRGWKRGMVGTPRPRPARQSSTPTDERRLETEPWREPIRHRQKAKAAG